MKRNAILAGLGLLFLILVLGGSVLYTTETGSVRAYKLLTGGVYVLMGLGFLCLNAWAFLRGRFDDFEEPKYRMLELEDDR
jgi:hypothetical protein